MKFLILTLLLCTILSCGDSFELTTPASYTYTSTSVESAKAYRYNNGDYLEVSIEQVGSPNTLGLTGDFDLIELLNDNTLKLYDDVDLMEESYNISNDKLKFRNTGSSYSMDILKDGEQLTMLKIGGGPFNDQSPYPWVRATCEDEGCDDVTPSEYLFSTNEETIEYIVIYKEVYTKQ